MSDDGPHWFEAVDPGSIWENEGRTCVQCGQDVLAEAHRAFARTFEHTSQGRQ